MGRAVSFQQRESGGAGADGARPTYSLETSPGFGPEARRPDGRGAVDKFAGRERLPRKFHPATLWPGCRRRAAPHLPPFTVL